MELEAEPHQSETGLIYRLRRGQPHSPLIVMLHGLSGDENVMWIFDHALPRAATVIAARALYASELGGYSWARSVVRDDLDQVDYTAARAAVQALIAEVTRLYEVDPQRVIVMGFSQGAALSYTLSLAQPQLLRGVIALAGYLPEHAQPAGQHRAAAKAPKALPHYLIIHGTQDEAVPIDRARQARSILESRGASVEYHEHHVGHRVSAQGMKEITRWIRQILA
ncbi:MAG TPA: alpha/beta fold hydrolase [Anaerolineae bacterium]|nr:alpha/beta fold hydrolase [Anaerolineae bacterium]